MELKPKPEIWLLVPQLKLVGQASCINNTMVFGFHWIKSFWSLSQKLPDVRARAKNFQCLLLEPEPEI